MSSDDPCLGILNAVPSMKQYALYDTEEGTVKLKCPKEEEHVCCTNVKIGIMKN